MSAVVCGSKRSFFEDLPATPNSSSPVSKKLRCVSPIGFSPFSYPPSLLDRLKDMFPDVNYQLLRRALEECGNDLDSAIKSLHELRLGSGEKILSCAEESDVNIKKGMVAMDGDAASSDNLSASSNAPMDGAEWVELLVREILSATSVDDARLRATRVLEILEKSISARAGAEAVKSFSKENVILKEHIEVLIRENSILKRAVAIQHERQKEYDTRNEELQHLKQLASQYQEQLRKLEVNNYALTMHLKQAQQSNSLPGRFHPDVF